LSISLRFEALWWAKERPAHARAPCLSENSRNYMVFCLTHRLGGVKWSRRRMVSPKWEGARSSESSWTAVAATCSLRQVSLS